MRTTQELSMVGLERPVAEALSGGGESSAKGWPTILENTCQLCIETRGIR